MNAGIDYGMGRTNIDLDTGIRYGVISQHSISQAWCDSAEPVYPESEQSELDEDCDCEPAGWAYDDEGYQMQDCLDSDVMITKSPFYTMARYCSPCVPGAGNLNSPDQDYGVKTYCVGHDWFDDCKAPYPVYEVATGKLVEAEESCQSL